MGPTPIFMWSAVITIPMDVATGSVSVPLLVIFPTGIKRLTLTQATVPISLGHH